MTKSPGFTERNAGGDIKSLGLGTVFTFSPLIEQLYWYPVLGLDGRPVTHLGDAGGHLPDL